MAKMKPVKIRQAKKAGEVEIDRVTIRGRVYGAAIVQVSLGLGGMPAYAVVAAQERWVTSRRDARAWLADRGLTLPEAERLLDWAEAKQRLLDEVTR